MIHPNVLTVQLEDPYFVYVGGGFASKVITMIAAISPKASHVVIVADAKLYKLYYNTIIKFWDTSNLELVYFFINAKESNKTIDVATDLAGKIIEKGIVNKNTPIVALGGGVVGDIVGLCGSLIFRGIPLFHVPTTLMAQSDSSLGGKNGVNTKKLKNALGTLYQPKAVFIDTEFLKSLPKRQLVSGYTECLKYALLFDERYFNYLEENISGLLRFDIAFINYIVEKSVQLKIEIVEQDVQSIKNIRHLLNLGHTFGHAVEACFQYKKVLHGEAVALGIILIFRFAHFLNMCSLDDCKRVEAHIIAYLPKIFSLIEVFLVRYQLDQIIGIIMQDKKNMSNAVSFVLPYRIGECHFISDIDVAKLKSFLTKELSNVNK